MAVFIIDGSSFLYRAYYSIKPLTAISKKTGEKIPVNAVYGFCRMIKKLLEENKPEYMLVVWDSKGKTFRHELYTEYKQTRQSPPSDLFEQKKLIQEFCEIINLTQLEKIGIEADDLMYSVAKNLELQNINSIIVTSDKDLNQALDKQKKITILDPLKNLLVDYDTAKEKYGFAIEKLPFYFSLIGDSSDNIPGVRGIGPKTAEKIVQNFESLEDLYLNLKLIENKKTRELLINNKEHAFLSQNLFLLQDQNLKVKLENYAYKKDNWFNSSQFFMDLNFKSLIDKLDQQKNVNDTGITDIKLANKYNFVLINTQIQLNNLIQDIENIGHVAVDTESMSLNSLTDSIIGVSLCIRDGEAYYIPFGHKPDNLENGVISQLSKQEVLFSLKQILESNKIKKYMHHAKFDILMFYSAGIQVQNLDFDTIIAASLLLPETESKGLKALSEYYFQETMLSYKEIVKDQQYKNFGEVPLHIATQYAAADAHQTFKLTNLLKILLLEQKLDQLYYSLEIPFLEILIKMEKTGIFLDIEKLKIIGLDVDQELNKLNNRIRDLIGPDFGPINLNSPRQLENLLFNHLKLPTVSKTVSKESYSTNASVLQELISLHPIIELIIKYRELYKLKTTYIEALPEYINNFTKKIHTRFNQYSVATGRLASSDPNLQNIPVDKYNIRSCFKPAAGYQFIGADYSQIELRVLAYMAQEPKLIEAFQEGHDIHALTAAGLFGVEITAVSQEQRQIGKRINFSILYGITAHGLSKELKISNSQAKIYINKYMEQYPAVSNWMKTVIEKTELNGYVETYLGRKRYIPYIHEKNKNLYQLGCRMAINMVGQGTAAEIVKMGMLNLQKAVEQNKLQTKILLQIHDEVVLEVPESELATVKKLVKSSLENIVDWNIPLGVSVKTGLNWQEITK